LLRVPLRSARSSVGDVEGGSDLRWVQAHDEFVGHTVAFAVLLGTVGTHAATADDRRQSSYLVEVIVQRDRTVDLHERVGRHLIVDNQRCPDDSGDLIDEIGTHQLDRLAWIRARGVPECGTYRGQIGESRMLPAAQRDDQAIAVPNSEPMP